MLPQEIFITGLSKVQFPAFSGSELVNQEGIMLTKNEIFDLPIIIVSFQLFVFYSINK